MAASDLDNVSELSEERDFVLELDTATQCLAFVVTALGTLKLIAFTTEFVSLATEVDAIGFVVVGVVVDKVVVVVIVGVAFIVEELP